MHPQLIARILGTLLALFSVTMLPPILVSYLYNDGAMQPFISAFCITLITGFTLWLPTRRYRSDLRTRDGFLITAMFWFVLGSFGALPFYFSSALNIGITDAIFESMSGLTTTGATVLTGLDTLPKSLLFYRQQLQWFGGIGIIVIAVAILPMLGIGGMQLYRAEAPGPVKDNKLTPRITETAKSLFAIYFSLTAACGLSYWLAGMSAFDAISHSFSTIAIGGFSTHDASLGYFDNNVIVLIATFFMLASGINFALHFFAWRHRSVKHYLQDSEAKFYFFLLITGCILTVFVLTRSGVLSAEDAWVHGVFTVVSIGTTTGFATENFSAWPQGLPWAIFFLAFAGGCAGSTGGGMKCIRVLLVWRQALREVVQLVHPNAVIPVKLGKRAVAPRVTEAVWGFIAAYFAAFLMLLLGLLFSGLNFETAFSAVAACLNNLGPGLGDVAAHYGNINDVAKWLLSFAMLLGRLEVFTLLVLFSPTFWRS